MNDSSIFSQHHRIDTTMINISQRLGLFGLLGLLQDAAVEHANSLNLTHERLLEEGLFWVLTQQRLRMRHYPRWNETISIHTWAKPINGIYATREYAIFLGQEKIGECATTWMILDSETHRPKRVSDAAHLFPTRKDGLDLQTEKVQLPDLDFLRTFEVSISDLDMNQHVNNTKYAQWLLDTIPIDYHREYVVKEYSMNFTGQTFLGDQIDCFGSRDSTEAPLSDTVHYAGIRQSDEKSVFRAKMVSQKL